MGEDADGAAAPAAAIEWDPPRVAGVLPILDDEPDPGTGRLLATEPAAARDYDEAAGHLADADVDLILVETRAGESGVRTAIEAAARTGVPVWVAAMREIATGTATGTDTEALLARWAEVAVDAGASGLLLADDAHEAGPRIAEAVAAPIWGGLVGDVGDRSVAALEKAASTWLDAGAGLIGLLRGASPERVRAIRAVIDQRTREERERERERRGRWDAILARGAAMAPGGAALWLEDDGDTRGIPEGFAWMRASRADASRLPTDHFRLTVARSTTADGIETLAATLEHGGILVVELQAGGAPPSDAGQDIRLVSLDADETPILAIYRRED